jgi:hypothetical protein
MSETVRPRLTSEGDCLVVRVPLRIRRRRGRREIIAPAGLEEATPAPSGVNRGLAVMVARAHRWRELLETGRYATIRALAADLGVDNSYVARILRLTLLAPDLVEAILESSVRPSKDLLIASPDSCASQRVVPSLALHLRGRPG